MLEVVDFATASVLFLALAGSSGGPAGLAAASDPLAITGGDAVRTCGWPSTVWMQGCTGTLIDPQHVIYAAHCEAPREVFFGEDSSAASAGRWVRVEECSSFPGGRPGQGNDFALCRLEAAVVDVPIVPPLMGCEVEALQPGAEVTIVGFGLTPQGDYGVKHEVTTTINMLTEASEASIGGEGKDSCQGDSGGPVFIELPDGAGWRVFGITSYGSSDCNAGGFYSLVHLGMPWFEETAERDLTPCHDAEGNWRPDPRCRAAPLDPATGVDAWPSCKAGPLSGPISTCGNPFAEPPDDHPPTVEIANPQTGAEFDTEAANGLRTIEVAVEADDVGWGVQWVELHVDGERAAGGIDFLPPFGFEVTFEPGVFELTAVAVDFAGNNEYSSEVWIGIDETPPSIPSSDADESDGCGCRAGERGRWGSVLFVLLTFGWKRRRRRSGVNRGRAAN